VGDGLHGEVEGVFHAHRPRGGLLRRQPSPMRLASTRKTISECSAPTRAIETSRDDFLWWEPTPVGDGLHGEVEGVFHAHRPRGGLLQRQLIAHEVGFYKENNIGMLGTDTGY
jgi:hypothetical protein